MSLVFDKQLLAQFRKISQQRNLGAVSGNALALKLLGNLEKDFLPPNPNQPDQISTSSDQPASLKPVNLEGLGSIASFLGQNQITVNGKQPVYLQDPDQPNYRFYRLEGTALYLEPQQDRGANKQGFWIDSTLLAKYLVSLQRQLTEKPNKVLEQYVSHLVAQSNQLMGTKIAPSFQAPEKTVADAQLLDQLPKDLSLQMPTQNGNVPLYAGDLQSASTFNNWLDKNSISLGGKMINHPEFDKCSVMRVLFLKAKYLASNAKSAQQKEIADFYLKQVEKLAPSITNADGTTCNLNTNKPSSSAVSTNNSESPSAQPKDKTTSQAEIINILSQLTSAMPLSPTEIDFPRIRSFFKVYSQLLSDKASNVQSAILQAENAMQNASNQTNNQMDNFPLSANVQQLGSWLSGNQGQREASALISNLRYVITNTAYVLSHLKGSYGKNIPALNSLLNAQIGETSNDQGYAGSNLNHLQVWQNQIESQSHPNRKW